MDDRLSVACGLLTSCLRGNPGAIRRQLPKLVPHVTSLMSSALAAPRLAEVYVALERAAFESRDTYLGVYCVVVVVVVVVFLVVVVVAAPRLAEVYIALERAAF